MGCTIDIGIFNSSLSEEFRCPSGYYKCHGSYCIPPYLICNGQQDCPNGEEEKECGRHLPVHIHAQQGHCCHAGCPLDRITLFHPLKWFFKKPFSGLKPNLENTAMHHIFIPTFFCVEEMGENCVTNVHVCIYLAGHFTQILKWVILMSFSVLVRKSTHNSETTEHR